jgi:hypothetical protein
VISQLYPANPSLVLNFTNTSTLDPRITFTRSTTATFTGSNGLIQTAAINGPRFDYNPTTLAPLGLLIEEQRVNLLLQSQDFTTSWGATDVSVTANTTAAPDGTTTADTLAEAATTAIHFAVQGISSSGVLTLSVFAKLNSGTPFLTIGFNSSAANYASATFNLLLGTSTQTQVGGTYSAPSATITAVAQGFYRCTFTATTDSVTTTRIGLNNTGTPTATNRGFGATYLGVVTNSIFVWGAQLEAGAFATSYIPTVASQVTRAADVAVMTGTNFSSWYNASEGTLYGQADWLGLSNNDYFFAINNGSTSNLIAIGVFSTSVTRFIVTDGGVTQASVAGPTPVANVAFKIAGAYRVNSFAAATNGVLGTVDTSGTVPTVDQASLTSSSGSTNLFNGHIRQIAYYPRRLANAELQGITA